MKTTILRIYAAVTLMILTVRVPVAQEDQQTEDMMMVAGEQRVFNAADIASFSESTRGVIEIKIPKDGRKMVVTAVRPGTTSLLLILRSGGQKTLLITVFSRRPEAIEKELSQLLADPDGLDLRRVGPRIFIDGRVASQDRLERIEQIVRLYQGQVASLVQVDPNRVSPRTNIRLDLTFVELQRRDGYDVGISWPGQVGGTQTVSGSLDLMTGAPQASYQVIDQTLPSIKAAELRGWVKIRKRATLVTTNGNRATYESGGEVNVAVAGSQAAEIRSVPYGCRLTVLPRLAPGPDILDLEVAAEVSDLTETSQDVPGRTLSKVETLVHLGLGQSILLSGLDSSSKSRSTDGLPLLARIPILGFFFGTLSGTEERTDRVILITPTVIENLDQQGKRLIEQTLSRFEKFDGDFE